jgi:cytochrome c biogenesis protein CcmG/thiol:disulfide interchange protein DsbE
MANRRGLKIALATAAIGLAAVLGLAALQHRSPSLAPDFAVPDLAGQAVRLSAFRGQVVLVNLWTTWCPPCREEMPSMERLYQRLKDRGLVLLAVSQDEAGKAAVEPFVRDLGLTFPVLIDPEHQVGDRYRVWGYPESFLIDREGRVAEHIIGPRDWAAPDQVAAVERLLETPMAAGE